MRVRACVWGWLCKSGCRTQPVRIIAARGFQDSYRHIPSGPQTSASASKYGTLSQKEKFLQCRMSAVVSSNPSKLCWPGPQEAAWTSLKMQALSENICAHLCLGSQWPLRNGIYLRVSVSHEKLPGRTVCSEGAWCHLLCWLGTFLYGL